jgi:large subunit ribosomal protein L22
MEFRAIEKFIRVSPFKTRKVAHLIQGKPVEKALALLHFMPKKPCGILEKAIRSAVANAEQSENPAALEDLWVRKIEVDEGPTMKRYHFRAQGRVYRVRKRSSHILVVLGESTATQKGKAKKTAKS